MTETNDGRFVISVPEVREFAIDHIQEEIDAGLIFEKGISPDNLEHDVKLYLHALMEGIINGVAMAGGSVDDLDYREEVEVER